MSGDAARTRLTKSATAGAPCTVAVGLFGLQKNTRPAPFDASTSLSMLISQVGVEIDGAHFGANLARRVARVLERRPRRRQRLGRRRERAHRVRENLAGARAERNLVVRHAVLAGQRLDQHGLVLLRVERITASFGKLADDDVDARAARGREGSRCWRCE